MNNFNTINAKEIRQDMVGFLKRLKTGQPLTIIYRSKPVVTIGADTSSLSYTQRADAGTPAAGRRSAKFVRGLPAAKPVLSPNKSFKQLYEETR